MRRFLPSSPGRGLLCLLLLVGLGGCRGCPRSTPPIHLNPNMDNQPKYRAQAASEFFADGATMRTPVAGTVARGEMPVSDPLHTGRQGDGWIQGIPMPVDQGVLARGAERYGIYCALCHGDQGNGRGMLYQRAQIQSADFSDPRLIEMADGQLFDTVTNGLGLMSGYGYVIPVEDRWAIISHVRTLQGLDAAGASVPNVAMVPEPVDEVADEGANG